jgi:hypothetical protein
MLKYWPEANKGSEIHFYNETLASAVEFEDDEHVPKAGELVIVEVENIDDLTMMVPFSSVKPSTLCGI